MRKQLASILLISVALVHSAATYAQNDERKYLENYDLKAASINTAAKENNISFYRNNQLILLKPDPRGKKNKPVPYTVSIKPNGDLGKPKLSKELGKLDLSGIVAYDSLTGTLYFAKYNKIEKDYALYETKVVKGKWLEPKQMDIEGTNTKRAHGSFMVNAGWSYRPKGMTGFKNPAIAKKGKRLYFTARIRDKAYGNVGSTDIYYIDQKEDGSWSKPQNLGKNINTVTKEDFAFCLGDTALYFSTQAKGVDIMKSRFVNGEWQKAERLPDPLNSGMNDQNILIGKDNVYLVSNRMPKGKDDIYLFRQKPPKPIIPPVIVVEPEDPVVEKIKTWNFTLFYFDLDKYVLSEEFTRQFAELVSEMKEFPAGTVFEVAGHTDQRASDKYNQKLSENRAQFVKDLLVKEGFPADNIRTIGYGETMPVIDDPKSEDDFQQNRRVEISIYNPNKEIEVVEETRETPTEEGETPAPEE